MPKTRHPEDKRDSRRRVIRTAYATTVAFLTALPVMTGYVPVDYAPTTEQQLAAFGAWVVFVNKAIATLEDFGVIPAWLRRDTNNRKEN